MKNDLLEYYEKELSFIRKLSMDFAQNYPEIAPRLLLFPDRSEDPQTERLLEAFAFLTGRIHKKIDEGFPKFIKSLLTIVYPHYNRPVPSMSIVQFHHNYADTKGECIDRNVFLHSNSAKDYQNNNSFRFKTCYPVTLLPIDIFRASMQLTPPDHYENVQNAICISLRARNSMDFSELNCNKFRFFLHGETHYIYDLYDLIMNNTIRVEYHFTHQRKTFSKDIIKSVGFRLDEGLLPYPENSHQCYRLLFEYFYFPKKFLYIDLDHSNFLGTEEPLGDSLDIWIYVNKNFSDSNQIDHKTFQMYSTPAVNLFDRDSEIVRIDHKKIDYPLIADFNYTESTEIYSVNAIEMISEPSSNKDIIFEPLYGFHHETIDPGRLPKKVFYSTERRQREKKENAKNDIYVSFSHNITDLEEPEPILIQAQVTCFNGDGPSKIPFGYYPSRVGEINETDFFLDQPGNSVEATYCLSKPTPSRGGFKDEQLSLKLLSHLSLNYMSLSKEGLAALKEILKLYSFEDSISIQRQIQAIQSINYKNITRKMYFDDTWMFCRGVHITIELDEDGFIGSGAYLFGCILNEFFTQYVSINSFTQLTLKSINGGVISEWKPKNGTKKII